MLIFKGLIKDMLLIYYQHFVKNGSEPSVNAWRGKEGKKIVFNLVKITYTGLDIL